MQTIGWDQLHVHSSSRSSPIGQAYCAGLCANPFCQFFFIIINNNITFFFLTETLFPGYLEGVLTVNAISSWFQNFKTNVFDNKPPAPSINQFLQDNVIYLQNMTQLYPNDPYWQHVNLILAQLLGMSDGYIAHRGPKDPELSFADFFLLNAAGDLQTLMVIFHENTSNLFEPNNVFYNESMMDCSAFVRVCSYKNSSFLFSLIHLKNSLFVHFDVFEFFLTLKFNVQGYGRWVGIVCRTHYLDTILLHEPYFQALFL
jgi:hypothetical protein